MSYRLTTYHWPLLTRPLVAGFTCPVTHYHAIFVIETLGMKVR